MLNKIHMITRSEILMGLTHYYENGDKGFIEAVNNISYGYKCQMQKDSRKHQGLDKYNDKE